MWIPPEQAGAEVFHPIHFDSFALAKTTFREQGVRARINGTGDPSLELATAAINRTFN